MNNEAKKEFKQCIADNVHRPGIDGLMEWLEQSGFYESPCSAKYHLCCPGGLVLHSLNVYKRLCKLMSIASDELIESVSPASLAIVALFHDLCKFDLYEEGNRWTKDEDGRWKSIRAYNYNSTAIPGHGDKSVMLITRYMHLTIDETLAIRYHMATWTDDNKNDVSNAFKHSELALLLHIADELATFIDEKEN